MIENTRESHPLVNLMVAMGENGSGIEAQERRGQHQLVESSQLPAKVGQRGDPKPFYEGCGIKVVGETSGDSLFLDVQLPEGWAIKSTDHSMWSNLKDNNGCTRATIFYKAAFYDREAFINTVCRYHTSWGKHPDNDTWRYVVVDSKSGNNLMENPWEDYGTANDKLEGCREWLAENYPDHGNPLAYWND
jgi:hypothetical protein